MSRPASSSSVWLGLGLAILLDTAVQFTWKRATANVPESDGPLQSLLLVVRQPLFHLTIILWITQFLNWILVLAKADLSFAQPVTALSYVSVAVLAHFSLHEAIGPMRAAGIALILAGVWQLSGTLPKEAP